MELVPGTQVTPTVRLVDLLGVGGMGSVWVAEHAALETRVAVKFISTELIRSEPTMLERFNREATLAAQIKSPHVVQILDHGIMVDGRPYIVMELLEGETLAERLGGGPLPLEMARAVITQTAKALAKAHGQGVVHRDIKPDNLFLTYPDEDIFLKVLDFGVAKQASTAQKSVTTTGAMIGTPEYMSPEQVLSARDVDTGSDLWALAVVAYHCLTGAVPFTGETLGSICVAIAAGKFVRPSKLRPELPAAIDHWFEKALALAPESRFGSAKELSTSFSDALSGKAVSAEPSDDQPTVVDRRGARRGSSPQAVQARTAHGSRTFAGATLSPARPVRRRLALAAAVALGLGAGTLIVFVTSDRWVDRDAPIPEAASEEPPASPPPPPEPSQSAAAPNPVHRGYPRGSASAAASAKASAAPSAEPSAAPVTPPSSVEPDGTPSAAPSSPATDVPPPPTTAPPVPTDVTPPPSPPP